MGILQDGSILNAIANTLDFAGYSATYQDLVSTIEFSPLLVSQLEFLSNAGDEAEFAAPSASNAGQPLVLTDCTYSDHFIVTYEGSLTAGQTDAVSETGVMVGQLAASYAAVADANMAAINARQYGSFSLERWLGTLFLDKGKQDYNQFLAKQTIEANPKLPNDDSKYVLFDNGGTAAQATTALQTAIQEQSSHWGAIEQTTIDNFADSTWNTALGQSEIKAALGMSNSYGELLNVLGIDYSHVTSFGAFTDANSNLLTGTDIVTTVGGVTRVYNSSYYTPTLETTQVTDQAGKLHETLTDDASASAPVYMLTASNTTISQPLVGFETVIGVGDTVTFVGNAALEGDNNAITDAAFDPGSFALSVEGNNNSLVLKNGLFTDDNITLNGVGNTVVLTGAGPVSIVGPSTNTTLFGDASPLTYNAGGGTLVLGSGAATIDGSAATQVVFAGTGAVTFTGGSGYGDVIGGGSGHDVIHAAAAGGWYEGGSQGMNFIYGANSGAGTVLEAGGAGDTLIGGTAGGDYLLAGAGAETLIGGNTSGEQAFFTGSGTDTVSIGSALSVIVAGLGALNLQGAGYASVYENARSAADFYSATGGSITVSGFRSGVDHLHLGGHAGSVAYSGSNTVATIGSTHYTLVGVHANIATLFA